MLTGAALPVALLTREVFWDLSSLNAGVMQGVLVQSLVFTSNSKPSRGLLGWRLLPTAFVRATLLHCVTQPNWAPGLSSTGTSVPRCWDKEYLEVATKNFDLWMCCYVFMYGMFYRIQWLRKRGITSFCYLGLHIARR